MGKSDFKTLCKKAQEEIGSPLTLKVSAFSDTYDISKNYAGMIIYAVDGKFNWINTAGDTKGYKGRSFYFGILDTSKYPTQELLRDVGTGRVHHYLILKLTGREYTQDTVCCGGFAIHEGKLKYSSVWLNARDQYPKDSFGKSDGDKMLSASERELYGFAVEKWKINGSNKAHDLSDTLKAKLGLSLTGTGSSTSTSTSTSTSSGLVLPPRLSLSFASARWEWQGSDGKWNPYDASTNATLEQKYSSRSSSFTLSVLKSGSVTPTNYVIDFSTMTQTYGVTYIRKIRRSLV